MRHTIAFILVLLTGLAGAQGFQINIRIDSAANKEIKLAHYYLGNIFLKDSLNLDVNGSGVIKADTLLPQGLYKFYLDENNHFDFLLGADQTFSLSKSTFSSSDMAITGAIETQEFVSYTAFMKKLQTRGAELNKKLEGASGDEKPTIQAELGKLTSFLHNYWFRIEKEYPNTMLAAFLLANYVPSPDISTFPVEVRENDSLLLMARFKFQQQHYWDYFDYTDERLLYTPFYKSKLETWFTKVMFQHYDSLKGPVFKLIEEVRPNKRIFQFVCSWLLNSSISSNIMGMDALFVDLARAYYLNGQAFWATEESLKKIRENVIFFEHNLIGKTAPDLTLENIDGEFVNLHKLKSKFTILVIYEPDCSHCKVFVPQLYTKVFQKFKDKGLSVYAIYSMDKKDEWSEFLIKHNLFGWINVWDETNISQFKILYDARKTPAVYILDENKKIVAKSMVIEQIEDFMTRSLQ